ncbi:MAG: exodeoxyribonuclease VII small subunit [Pseudomonadota bacterium]
MEKDRVEIDWDSLPYEKLVEKLDEVVQRLESGELPLEESLQAFETGMRIARAAERQLDRAERRVELLLQDGRTEPLPPRQGADDEDLPF